MSRPSGRRRRTAATAVAALVLALAACGVPGEGQTETVRPDEVPYQLLSPAPAGTSLETPSTTTVSTPRIFLLDGADQLVGQWLSLDVSGVEPVVRSLLVALAAGPSEEQRTQGLGSALGPGVRFELLGVVDRTARLVVHPGDRSPSADRLPLAVGQVVLTLTSVDGVDRVEFVQDGRTMPAPLPGGEQTSAPLTAADYAVLLAPTTSTGPPSPAQP